MRLKEFVNAEDVLELWQLVSDTIWQAIDDETLASDKASTVASQPNNARVSTRTPMPAMEPVDKQSALTKPLPKIQPKPIRSKTALPAPLPKRLPEKPKPKTKPKQASDLQPLQPIPPKPYSYKP